MASLKDMRVRIAATKATQKITKAMQMVAAAKLRRAQAAAEAARPYAERMETVLANLASGVTGSSAPRHPPATSGPDCGQPEAEARGGEGDDTSPGHRRHISPNPATTRRVAGVGPRRSLRCRVCGEQTVAPCEA